MKYFCSKCGKTTQYSLGLPQFCAFCGQSFANKSATKEVEDKKNKFLNELKLKKRIDPTDIEDDESSILESNIDFKKIRPSFKLDVYQSKGESFGNLIDNPSAPIEIQNQNTVKTKTKEEILAEFQREAGSLRSK
jgi:DNA-directed RNA polymerase subunit RPC12/RpoP